jgi:hypothetical protein
MRAEDPMSTLSFPGRIIQLGDSDQSIVAAIQQRLVERGCGPLEQTNVFDARTRAAVRLFQARFPDRSGAPLVVDGKVGLLTWESLFGEGSVPSAHGTSDALLAKMLEIAAGEIGVLEEPRGSNRGPRVDEYLRVAGLNPADGSFPWCAAFVFWCSEQAVGAMGRENPVIRTPGVLTHWQKAGQAGIRRIVSADATADPASVRPGMIFIMDFGGGAGHTGLVESVDGGRLVTIEGNTNDDGSRDGVGVFRRVGRKVLSINRGFIDYGGR